MALVYQLPPVEVVKMLGSDAQRGLSPDEAARRLEQYGRNELESEPPIPAWRRFLAQFQSPLVILLLIATVISFIVWLIERESALPFEAIAIFAIVLLNAILGYIQEARAEKAVAALKAMSAAQATVIRGGERREVPAAEIVPGDILLIEEGDTIAADARLLQVTGLQAAEASLTGESLPVTKDVGPIAEKVGVGDRRNMVFSGTAATYGRGRAIVTTTGMKTEMGHVAGMLQQAEETVTPLQEEINRVGNLLGRAVVVIAVVIIATILITQGVSSISAVVDVLILGVSLAVAAVPEGLATILTVVLALGVQRMAKRNAIIRKLAAVETLGSASVIATDKTGTLTKNEMTVRTAISASGRVDFSGIGYSPEGEMTSNGQPVTDEALRVEVEKTLRASGLANNAVVQQHDGKWAIQGDPTEGALLVAAMKAGLEPEAEEGRFARVGEVPFSSERKMMSTVHADAEKPERVVVYAKGAPDVLLARCSHERLGEGVRPLTPERREEIQSAIDQLASEALRTLGIAFRTLPKTEVPIANGVATTTADGAANGVADGKNGSQAGASQNLNEADLERDFVFLGLVGMIDPPRPEAKDSVHKAHSAGIRVMMVTGDHPRTAAAIATELGIIKPGERAVAGAELEGMDEEQLRATVKDVSVYARVSPEHKLRIVKALKRNGEVVAMTGDGVNDAPALKTADIGVAMGITGTDVSKEAADMVLTDDNFASIVAAVEEGRAIFANIRKFLRYLLSSNIGEVLTMFFGVILAGVIGLVAGEGELIVLPLLATQILWINLATDAGPALAVGIDPADPGVMDRPPRARDSRIIDGRMWFGIFFVGAVMAVGTLLVLDGTLPGGLIDGSGSLDHARSMAFTTLVFFQLFNVF
ncbi:MAG: cation-translocating P-type ATPase, partial [Anaerolineae bacterium]|nr:cation-translocating P-type ATPase [Anaerolineae bacterium]